MPTLFIVLLDCHFMIRFYHGEAIKDLQFYFNVDVKKKKSVLVDTNGLLVQGIEV